MQVHYYPVPDALAAQMATLHRGELAPLEAVEVPAILGQVWFCDGPVFIRFANDREPQLLPRIALVGFTTGAFELASPVQARIYGVGLWPLGWAEIVRQPACDLADRAVNAAQRWPELQQFWPDAEACATPEAECQQHLEQAAQWLHEQASPTDDAGIIREIDAWLQSADDLATLAQRLGVSSRHLQRITLRTHGGTPRLIASKWRVLRAAASMHLLDETSDELWKGFSDQSHFIREFRRFTGITPGAYKRAETTTRRVLADEWHLRSDHPLALASKPKTSRG